MRGDPVVDRPHARSSVETDDLAVRPGPAEIGDAAEVDDGRVRARPQVLQERVMIGNRYGRAMSSRRSEEHTSELQSLMRISYAVFCLKKKKEIIQNKDTVNNTI